MNRRKWIRKRRENKRESSEPLPFSASMFMANQYVHQNEQQHYRNHRKHGEDNGGNNSRFAVGDGRSCGKGKQDTDEITLTTLYTPVERENQECAVVAAILCNYTMCYGPMQLQSTHASEARPSSSRPYTTGAQLWLSTYLNAATT